MTPAHTYPGILHRILPPSSPAPSTPPIVAFEHVASRQPEDPSPAKKNTLIFLGGLFDGLLTVPFVPHVVSALPSSWSLIEPTLSSAYKQWGFASLREDVDEIARVVEYFRKLRPKGNIILLGHSTGSQQIMHYLLFDPARFPIDGGIMQASASDREAITMLISDFEYRSACRLAQAYVNDGRADDILPISATESIFMTAPVSAKRWLSLASPPPDHVGEDDYFSSDLDDSKLERTFGRLGKAGAKIMFLYSGEDQYVPDAVDKGKLVRRWHEHVKRGGGVIDPRSGIIEEASHTLQEGGDGLDDLVTRVLGFLSTCESINGDTKD